MCTDGETPIQTESGLWVMAYEGEAGDRRIWPCLPVSKSGIALPLMLLLTTLHVIGLCVVFFALSYCCLVILPLNMKKMLNVKVFHCSLSILFFAGIFRKNCCEALSP